MGASNFTLKSKVVEYAAFLLQGAPAAWAPAAAAPPARHTGGAQRLEAAAALWAVTLGWPARAGHVNGLPLGDAWHARAMHVGCQAGKV